MSFLILPEDMLQSDEERHEFDAIYITKIAQEIEKGHYLNQKRLIDQQIKADMMIICK